MIDHGSTHRMLERVTNDVVRRFSNLPVRPADDLIALPSEECVCGRAHFGGPMSGVITVAAPVGLCRDMAAWVPGSGAGGDAMLCATQTIAELADVITGHVTAALMPEHAFTLSASVSGRSSYHDWVVMSCAGGTVRLNVGGHPLLTSLILLPA